MYLRAPLRRPLRTPKLQAALIKKQHASSSSPAAPMPLTSILIANRGEIALRVNRTASQYGVRTTTIYTDPDAQSQHALSSPFSVNLGDPSEYLNGDKIIQVAKDAGCNGIHPGYGFLSENSAFARKCTEAGLVFIGPPWEAIEAMGNKSRSKDIMIEAGVPCIPGYHGEEQDPAFLRERAEEIGFPVLIKAVRGGGGKGMRIAATREEFADQLESAKTEARNSFGDEVMLVEKYIVTPRHIEVQVFADKHGNCVALGERDCSIQRRHQKILEESPAPHLDEEVRQDLWDKARKAAAAVGYEGAGTVEFVFDNDSGNFYFMEMNTRLQVEHPVTEMVTGEDLVHWQLVAASGSRLPLTQEEIHERIKQRGWAIEARIYAENPNMNFMPDSGTLVHLRTPTATEDVRIDAGFVAGDEVSSHYDPMIAKLIVRGPDRATALRKLGAALEEYEIAGPATNIEFLKRVCEHPAFVAGEVETGFIPKHRDALFTEAVTPPEVFAQAALASLIREAESSAEGAPPTTSSGFTSPMQSRTLVFASGSAVGGRAAEGTQVHVDQTGSNSYDVSVGPCTFPATRASFDGASSTLRTFFPHTRLDARVVFASDGDVTLFTRGARYCLSAARPRWMERALGTADLAHSVVAPMPCKVLKVEVAGGDEVTQGQALVVIESMKMETVIRSPQDGRVKKVVHGVGDLVKAGVALVEFEE